MSGNQRSWQRALALGSTISTTLAALVGGGYFLGHYLDGRWDTEPVLTITMMLVGLVLGGSYLVFALKKLGTADDSKK